LLFRFPGERPFKCWICGTAFRRKDNLDRHIKNTHNQPKEVAKQLANEAAAEYLASSQQGESSKDPTGATHKEEDEDPRPTTRLRSTQATEHTTADKSHSPQHLIKSPSKFIFPKPTRPARRAKRLNRRPIPEQVDPLKTEAIEDLESPAPEEERIPTLRLADSEEMEYDYDPISSEDENADLQNQKKHRDIIGDLNPSDVSDAESVWSSPSPVRKVRTPPPLDPLHNPDVSDVSDAEFVSSPSPSPVRKVPTPPPVREVKRRLSKSRKSAKSARKLAVVVLEEGELADDYDPALFILKHENEALGAEPEEVINSPNPSETGAHLVNIGAERQSPIAGAECAGELPEKGGSIHYTTQDGIPKEGEVEQPEWILPGELLNPFTD